MVVGLTGGETVLVIVAAVFILFSLAVSMLVPRFRPSFPGDRLGFFIFVTLILFVAMMTAVVTATGGEEHGGEAAAEETEPGETGTEPGGTETGPGETETGGQQPGGDAAAGEQVFASAGCGSCHTLSAADSTGTIGPNLDEAQPTVELAVERVTNGSGAMPAFSDQLSEKQIQDVAAYVAESTSG